MAAQAPEEPQYHSDDRVSTHSDDPPRCLPLQQRWNDFAAGLPPPPPKPTEEPRYRSDDPRRHSTWGTRPVSQEEFAEIAAAGGPTVAMWDAYFLQQKIDNPERFGAPPSNVYDDIARDAAAAGDDGSALTPEDAPAPDNSSLDDLSSQDTAGREAQAKEMQAKLNARAGGDKPHGLFGMMSDAPRAPADDDDEDEEFDGVVERWMARNAPEALRSWAEDETTATVDALHADYVAMIGEHWSNVCDDEDLPFVVREDMDVLSLREVALKHMIAVKGVELFLEVCEDFLKFNETDEEYFERHKRGGGTPSWQKRERGSSRGSSRPNSRGSDLGGGDDDPGGGGDDDESDFDSNESAPEW
ncbi:hypothetical protein JL721_11045 [Aureococcus anophagefferens]|nr:hypothetical protein JL721_11045 [Aureococcus anophagefferens]